MKKWMLILLFFAVSSQNLDVQAVTGKTGGNGKNPNRNSKKNPRSVAAMKQQRKKITSQERRQLRQLRQRLQKLEAQVQQLREQHQGDQEGFLRAANNMLVSSGMTLAELRLIFNFFNFSYPLRIIALIQLFPEVYRINRRIAPYFTRATVGTGRFAVRLTFRTLRLIIYYTTNQINLLQQAPQQTNNEEDDEDSDDEEIKRQKKDQD